MTAKLYFRLLQYLRPYIFRGIIAIVCALGAALANLFVPRIIGEVIDKVLAAKDMVMLNTIPLLILLLYVFRGLCFYGQTYLMAYIGQKVTIDIREKLFRHLQKLPLAFFEWNQTGAIMSYVTNDVSALQGALTSSIVEFLNEAAILIGSVYVMFYTDWKLSIFTFLTVPLILHAIKVLGRKMRIASKITQERTSDITAVLQESISAVRVIKSFVREDYEVDRFMKENHKNFRAQMKTSQILATATPVIEFLAVIGVTLIIWFGGREVIDGQLTTGQLIAFLMYVVNFSNPIKRVTRTYGEIEKAMASAQRVFEVLDIKPDIQNMPDAIDLPKVSGQITFEDVSFVYKPDEQALADIFFAVKPGQMVALVGPSGAGKTTIASLLPRFYDVIGGRVLLDNIDIRTVTLQSLREQIGIVPQETILFNGTVYENILYGRLEAAKDEVIAAAKAANAHNFIMHMPEGYDTHIGERGCKLSGGQRQRIAIARAILKNPRILIMDEATSALDTESEKLVQEALDKLMVGRTSIVVAHRLSTIQRADVIIVMDKGRIVEQGTHKQLMQSTGLYSRLYNVQFNTQDYRG